jgi:glycosyltransferase involved in cell wall biosynthesis
MDLVSVVIPTYNRFHLLLDTIRSIKEQTHTNTEIIVVNDCSTQQEYYDFDYQAGNIRIIHLPVNTKQLYGFACAGHVRNVGIDAATGKYVAFCDDDDIWLPRKLELQLAAMKKYYCKMSATDGFIGEGRRDNSINYKIYLQEHYHAAIKGEYEKHNSVFFKNGFPAIWDYNFIKIQNCIVCSSAVVERDLLAKPENKMPCVRNGQEDIGCWLHVLQHTGCAFIPEPCFYYDNAHGYGQNY